MVNLFGLISFLILQLRELRVNHFSIGYSKQVPLVYMIYKIVWLQFIGQAFVKKLRKLHVTLCKKDNYSTTFPSFFNRLLNNFNGTLL